VKLEKLKKLRIWFLGVIGGLLINKAFSNFSFLNLFLALVWSLLFFHYLFQLNKLFTNIKKLGFKKLIIGLIKLLIFISISTYLLIIIPKQLGYNIDINIGRVKGDTDDLASPNPEKTIKANQPENQVTTNCQNKGLTFCSDFSNIEKDFEGLDFFSTDPENQRILKSNVPISGSKDNPILWIKNLSLSPEFHFNLTSKLFDDKKGNLTFVFGNDLRCIIGENNFNTITCEAFYSNTSKKERKSQHLSSKKLPPIQPETELLIRGSTSIVSDDKLKITLSLEYFDSENSKKETTFDFETKYLSTNPQENKKNFGVGIIDPHDEGISVEFMKLEIKGGL